MSGCKKFECYQTAEDVAVICANGCGSAVIISRAAVGDNPKARALMRLCRDVLNGDLLAAQRELDGLHPKTQCANCKGTGNDPSGTGTVPHGHLHPECHACKGTGLDLLRPTE